MSSPNAPAEPSMVLHLRALRSLKHGIKNLVMLSLDAQVVLCRVRPIAKALEEQLDIAMNAVESDMLTENQTQLLQQAGLSSAEAALTAIKALGALDASQLYVALAALDAAADTLKCSLPEQH